MSGIATGPAAGTTVVEDAPGLLDQILSNTKQTEPDRAQDLVNAQFAACQPIRIVYEKVFKNYLLRSKKRYAGLKF